MSVEVSNLDHLGLVAGIIDEIGIEKKINQLIGEDKSEQSNSNSGSKRNALEWVILCSVEQL